MGKKEKAMQNYFINKTFPKTDPIAHPLVPETPTPRKKIASDNYRLSAILCCKSGRDFSSDAHCFLLSSQSSRVLNIRDVIFEHLYSQPFNSKSF